MSRSTRPRARARRDRCRAAPRCRSGAAAARSRAVITACELVALDDVVRRGGGGDDDVGPLELGGQRRRSAPPCRRSAGRARSRGRSGGWRRTPTDTPRSTSARAVSSPVSPAPTITTRRPRQVAERLPRELHGDRAAPRRSPRADRGLGAHALAGGERLAEEPVHDRARGALDERQLVGALHLTLDLGLADDHRVEARGHAEQVPGGVVVAQRVQVRRPARWGGCRPGGRGSPSAVVSASTSSPTARYSSVRLQVESATASWMCSVETSSRSTLAARPSGSATRSRSSTGAVLWEMPSASSSLIAPFHRRRSIASGSKRSLHSGGRPPASRCCSRRRVCGALVDAALDPGLERLGVAGADQVHEVGVDDPLEQDLAVRRDSGSAAFSSSRSEPSSSIATAYSSP